MGYPFNTAYWSKVTEYVYPWNCMAEALADFYDSHKGIEEMQFLTWTTTTSLFLWGACQIYVEITHHLITPVPQIQWLNWETGEGHQDSLCHSTSLGNTDRYTTPKCLINPPGTTHAFILRDIAQPDPGMPRTSLQKEYHDKSQNTNPLPELHLDQDIFFLSLSESNVYTQGS